MGDRNIVEEWLKCLHLGHYAESFMDNGYDDLEICKQIGEPDLDAIGVMDVTHRQLILQAVRVLLEQGATSVYFTLEETLRFCSQSNVDYDDSNRVLMTPKSGKDINAYGGGYGYSSDVSESPGMSSRKYVDEYEEGKAELVKFPKIQLKMMIRDKLVRDNVRLSAQPYSHPDGTRGNLESLAAAYAEELRTHYHDVLERLEELRRRRVAIDFPPLLIVDPATPTIEKDGLSPKHGHNYKPGKYSPSSCLSDHEEASIYEFYQGPPCRNKSSPQRCLSPRSRFFYEPCPFPSGECRTETNEMPEQTKKRSGLGKLFRSLGSRKGSPRHGHKSGSWKLASYGSQKRLAEVFPGEIADEERIQLTWMVREGYISMEQAIQRIRHHDKLKQKSNKYVDRNEMITELGKNVMLSPPSRKKNQPKCKSIFYSDLTKPSSHIYDDTPTEDLFQTHEVDKSCPHSRTPCPLCMTVPSKGTCWTFSPIKHPKSALDRPKNDIRAYSHDDFTSAILERTFPEQHCSAEATKSTVCGGDCGNIMCSVTASMDLDETDHLISSANLVGSNVEGCAVVVAPTPSGDVCNNRCSATSCSSSCSKHGSEYGGLSVHRRRTKSEGCCSSGCSVRNSLDSTKVEVCADYGSSPVLDRRNKGVLDRLRNLKGRSSFSTSEEGHSSDYDEQEEGDKKMNDRPESNGHSTSTWAGRVRDLQKGVKQKISKFRSSRSISSGDHESPQGSINPHEPALNFSSMESIPSDSGSRSSPQANTPTSSNRSSTSTGEEENSRLTGTVIGQARALVDYTPSPYDKDGLAFRKGDIIDILEKPNTGTWIGRVHGHVGHFKFINVEEITKESKRSRRHIKRQSEGSNIPNSRPKSLDELLQHLGLEVYTNVLVLNGYNSLDSFRELEAEDLLDLGITNLDHQFKILKAADLLDDESSNILQSIQADIFAQPVEEEDKSPDAVILHKLSPRDSGCYASNENIQKEIARSLPSNGSLPLENGDQDISQSESGIQSSEGPDSTSTINNLDLSASSSGKCDIASCQEDTAVALTESKKICDNVNTCEFNIPLCESPDRLTSIAHNSRTELEIESKPIDLQLTNPDTGQRFRSSENICNSRRNYEDINGPRYFSFDRESKSLPFSTFAAELKMALSNSVYEQSNRKSKTKKPPLVPKRTTPAKYFGSNQKVSEGHNVNITQYSSNVSSYYSQYEDCLDNQLTFQESPAHISCGSGFAKKVKSATLPRKKPEDEILPLHQNPVDIYVATTEKKSSKKSSHRKTSLQPPSHHTRPTSLNLLTAVIRKLEEECIDFSLDPYTDKTGFCGIPPALVQRYAEELNRDVFDVAEALDQARIHILQLRGRRGIPNDFLADSCGEPVLQANYTSLSHWLISLGLPMYEPLLQRAGFCQLYQIARMRDSDLRSCGISNARHIRLLTTAIGALYIYLGQHSVR